MIDFRLMPHQSKAIEKARTTRNMALFMDAGLGKTATMIRILAEDFMSHGSIKNTLIIAPLTVCPQWKTEIMRFSRIPEAQIHVLTGTGASRVKAMEELRKFNCGSIIITNYEAMTITAFYDALVAWQPKIMVCDEIHRIKDATSKRAKKIYGLMPTTERRFGLTGTPILNSLMDIFGQIRFLEPSIFGESFFTFRRRYFYDRNHRRQNSFPDWVPQKHAAEDIGNKIAGISIQAKREECLELPPLQKIFVPVAMGPAQSKAYLEMKKHFVTEIQGMVSSSEFEMVKTLRLQQILSGFILPDGDHKPKWFDEVPRINALMDIVDSIGNEKLIIWTVFRATYPKIAEALGRRGLKYGYLTGEQTHTQKSQVLDEFIRGDMQVIVANPGAASEGINLQVARYAVYFTRGYNLLHYLQSMARNYRSGSEKLHQNIAHYHLYTPGTLDEVIAKALVKKQNVGQAVMEWAKADRVQFPIDETDCRE